MKSTVWNGISLASGALAAIAVRKLIAAVWPGRHEPPLNPADRRIDWGESIAWAISSGIGAGVARMVSTRTAAAGWEMATGDTPPGVR
jgi:hypothetical protein